MDNYELLSSETVFEGKMLNIKHDVIKTPQGGKWLREIVTSRPASAVVPVDCEGNIILVNQYRHAVRRITLEIPAGITEYGETPEETARRELEEETGYAADKLVLLTALCTSIGFCTELVRIYLAEGLSINGGNQKLDPDELVTVSKYKLGELKNMIKDGTIKDSKTIVGILMYSQFYSG